MDKNSFAPLPPMGWNSYDYYDTTVNEAQIRANAEYMAKHLKPFGFLYSQSGAEIRYSYYERDSENRSPSAQQDKRQ